VCGKGKSKKKWLSMIEYDMRAVGVCVNNMGAVGVCVNNMEDRVK